VTRYGYTLPCERATIGVRSGGRFTLGVGAPDRHVAAVAAYRDARVTDIALVRAGGEPPKDLLGWAEDELLPARRELDG
jgi:hypothetical protein